MLVGQKEKREMIVENGEEKIEEVNEQVYDITSDVPRKLSLLLERVGTVDETPKSKTSSTNPRASYTKNRNAYIKTVNQYYIPNLKQ